MKKKLVLGSIVSLGFLFLAGRGIQWDALWEALSRTRWAYFLPTVFFTLLGLFFRAYRWRFMLLPVKRISTAQLLSATSIGYMANNLLPARLGEIVRAYVLGKQENISKSASFATIVYERVIDIFSLLVLLWLFLVQVPGPGWLPQTGYWLLALNVLVLAAIIVIERHRAPAQRLIQRMLRPFPVSIQQRAYNASVSFTDGLAAVSSLQTILPIAITSVLVWLCAVLGAYYCLGALDIDLAWLPAISIIVLVSFGSMIPSAPAFVGTTQYACVVGLGLFGVGNNEALAFSLIYHAAQFFPVTLLGLAYLWRMQIRFEELSKKH